MAKEKVDVKSNIDARRDAALALKPVTIKVDEINIEGSNGTLTLSISDNFREWLNLLVVKTKTSSIYLNSETTVDRYLILKHIRQNLSDIGQLLFSKDIIENGKITLNVSDLQNALEIKEGVEQSVTKVFESECSLLELLQDTTINVSAKEE